MKIRFDRIERAQALMRAQGIVGIMVMNHDDYRHFFGADRTQPSCESGMAGARTTVLLRGASSRPIVPSDNPETAISEELSMRNGRARWWTAGVVALILATGGAYAEPGGQAAEARLVTMGYSPAEARTKLSGLTEEEMALVAEDPSIVQVGGIDAKQGAMILLVTVAFFMLIFFVF